MSIQIIPFESGINTSYIIKDKGVVMVDGAPFKNPASFSRILEDHSIEPEEVSLIILTHGDFDHVGGVKTLKELTGAKAAIHEKDRENLEKGIFNFPHGVTYWGKFSRFILKPIAEKIGAFSAVKTDIVLGDEGLSLEEYGIHGRVLYTPGHTFGSVSVLLETGDAFVGCLAHNRPPFVLKPRLPIFAEDIELLKSSFKEVIERGAKIIYPGHGKPFPVERILKYLN